MTLADDCYRCGYDLRDIAGEQPCPECGLLARRSRRPSDELHLTRPRWLKRMSRGIVLLLVIPPIALVWPMLMQGLVDLSIRQRLVFNASGIPIGSRTSLWQLCAELLATYGGLFLPIAFLAAITLVSSREGYLPADRADRRRRIALRIFAALPLITTSLVTYIILQSFRGRISRIDYNFQMAIVRTAVSLLTFGCLPLPILLFIQLRSVAQRVQSAHLAEHCMIAGIGSSVTLLLIGVTFWFWMLADRWGFDARWFNNSTASLVLSLIPVVACFLFVLWAMYLLLRFAITFARASRRLRREWKSDDRSLGLSDAP